MVNAMVMCVAMVELPQGAIVKMPNVAAATVVTYVDAIYNLPKLAVSSCIDSSENNPG